MSFFEAVYSSADDQEGKYLSPFPGGFFITMLICNPPLLLFVHIKGMLLLFLSNRGHLKRRFMALMPIAGSLRDRRWTKAM